MGSENGILLKTLRKYKVKGIVIITMLVPIAFYFLVDDPACQNIRNVLLGAIWTLLISFLIWTGCEKIDQVLDKKLAWRNQAVKRALLQISICIVYSIVVLFVVMMFQPIAEFQKKSNIIPSAIMTVIITLVVNLVGIGSYFFQEWKKSIEENELLKKQQLETQFASLKSQVNPHFLFNSLNTLSGLIEENQSTAVTFVEQMAEVYRYLLLQNIEGTVSLDTEIKFIKSYLHLNKMRFGDALQYQIDIKPADLSKKIVGLSLQMGVENAIKHNIITLAKPLNIKISTHNNYLIVSNNLQRKENVGSTGIGLINIQSQYQLVGCKNPVNILEDQSMFQLELPLI